jgi:hypothetical protein
MKRPPIDTVEKLFHIKIAQVEDFVRQDQDPVLNCFLTDSLGNQFFLKEIQEHSLLEGMDEIYRQLHAVQSSAFRFVLPKQHAANQFIFENAGKKFLLFHRESLKEFDSAKISFETLLGALDEMHQKTSGFQLPAQSYRTFASWIERGLTKVSEKYGEEVPFIPRFKKFMKDRYPTLNLGVGNIHWDIHKSNVCLDQQGKLVILDLDLMQKGELACDLSRAAFMYSSQDKLRFGVDAEIVESATECLKKTSPAVTAQDMRFFICRTPLGPMQLPDHPLSKDEAMAYLQSLDDFVGQ